MSTEVGPTEREERAQFGQALVAGQLLGRQRGDKESTPCQGVGRLPQRRPIGRPLDELDAVQAEPAPVAAKHQVARGGRIDAQAAPAVGHRVRGAGANRATVTPAEPGFMGVFARSLQEVGEGLLLVGHQWAAGGRASRARSGCAGGECAGRAPLRPPRLRSTSRFAGSGSCEDALSGVGDRVGAELGDPAVELADVVAQAAGGHQHQRSVGFTLTGKGVSNHDGGKGVGQAGQNLPRGAYSAVVARSRFTRPVLVRRFAVLVEAAGLELAILERVGCVSMGFGASELQVSRGPLGDERGGATGGENCRGGLLSA